MLDFNKIQNPVIYKVTNLVNNKVYIGKSVNFKNRYSKHKSAKYYNTYFHNAIRKYGFENFKFEILEQNIPIEILIKRENFYIDKYNSLDKTKGYNLRKDCKENSGFKHTEETKRKISEAGKGRKHIKRDVYIHILTKEGKKSFAKKMSGGNNPNSKIVYQYTKDGKFIKAYDSCSTAALLLNINFRGISRCAKRERKSYKGFVWSYFPKAAYHSNMIVRSPLIAGNSDTSDNQQPSFRNEEGSTTIP